MHSRSFQSYLVLLAVFFATPALAQVDVPTGAALSLGGGSLDLGNTSLQVGGSFAIGSGSVQNADSVAILSGGNLDGGSGALTLFGDWSNSGTFTAGSGTVNFVDGGIAQSNVSSNSTFDNVGFVSTTGKNYVFAVGTTQSVSGLLAIQGTAAQGIQFKSAAAGQVANIDLLPGGSQSIQYVGVSDVHATGQHLAASQTNDGGTGNAIGWFGAGINGGAVVPTPALSGIGQMLLALLTAVFAAFAFPTSRQRG